MNYVMETRPKRLFERGIIGIHGVTKKGHRMVQRLVKLILRFYLILFYFDIYT